VSVEAQTKIEGVVSDPTGATIAQAAVVFESNGSSVRTRTDDSGKFAFEGASAGGTLIVQAAGFSTARISVAEQKSPEPLRITLEPAGLLERILITASEERIPVTPTSQYSLGRREIATSGALTIDDVLRQTPGFSLFRRSGSLTANPTTQGVSLRGVGANGASRALVMYDGVPLNSPFGGWVYWNRLPRVSVESAQIFNGGTSDLYGSGALGGVVNITSHVTNRRSEAKFLELEASGGNLSTRAVSLTAGSSWDGFGVGVDFQALRTDGYVLVPENQRGTVDTPAGTSDVGGSLTLSKNFGSNAHAFVRLGSFGESRRYATANQRHAHHFARSRNGLGHG
jgi:outer membrane cobalamin receptor